MEASNGVKLIVGLGNPGDVYADSRHNIGFTVVKALAKAGKIPLKRDSGTFSLSAKIKIGSQFVMLAMPLTFMNLSGSSVSSLIKKYKIDLADLLVISDDLDLELGRMKLKARGSSGGHRGLKSIIDSIDGQEFARLRIGIGRPARSVDAAEYVLLPFRKVEKEKVQETIEKASDACEFWVKKGTAETMNIFNTRRKDNE